jgi:excisionase family DNA binding protein
MGEASALLGVHQNTIRRWEKEGKIRVVRVGKGHRKIPESEINRIIGGSPPASPIPAEAINEKSSFLSFVFSRHRDDWDLVKKAVIIRDEYACQECGSREMLEVHHKDGSGRNDPDNLITLCQKCHRKIHAQAVSPPPKVKIAPIKTILPEKKPVKEEKALVERPSEISSHAVLDALSPSGLAQRAAFGEILSVAIMMKKFTIQDLVAHAKCTEIVARTFCERLEKLGYLKSSGEDFEFTVRVTR